MDNKCRKHIILKVLESAIKKIFNPFQVEVRSISVLLQKSVIAKDRFSISTKLDPDKSNSNSLF